MCAEGPSAKWGAHIGMVAASVVLMLIYVRGVPLMNFLLMKRARKEHLLHSAQFLRRYCFLYTRYTGDFYNWNLVMLLRRFAFCVLAVFGGLQYERGVSTLSICSVGIPTSREMTQPREMTLMILSCRTGQRGTSQLTNLSHSWCLGGSFSRQSGRILFSTALVTECTATARAVLLAKIVFVCRRRCSRNLSLRVRACVRACVHVCVPCCAMPCVRASGGDRCVVYMPLSYHT